jgi:hypothetical protein
MIVMCPDCYRKFEFYCGNDICTVGCPYCKSKFEV